ncbi:FkbM family methyltransferase [Paraburkholderia sp. Ac-20340]|uniref:FkbM family methyltransferase n=1 Tax=Paraburkholderia sp. Ac-20340 TaxID=2703888 RepID=UPI00197DA595|nr:FkbM family methyltransferase [Paraburkholderia sp. Ac-20340]MBN3852510.1 FkbM family methyltransferase [Paraburkholderia sp. Ac-20340]
MSKETGNTEVIESGISALRQENDLLLAQLHRAQEELERSYSRNPESRHHGPSVSRVADSYGSDWVADELPEIHAENQRLQALVDVQRDVHRLATGHALNARLGNILIDGADAPRTLLSVPGQLLKIWRQSSRKTPPRELGGKDFGEVVARFRAAGFAAVEKLLDGTAVSPAMKATAYTALARQLMGDDRASAAEASRRAYALDPQAYRLKWLAFRLHEAGQAIEAEATLDVLPSETQFSDSEARQARQLRAEAKLARQSLARAQTAVVERRAAADKRLNSLIDDRDRESKRAIERAQQIEALAQAHAKLELDRAALAVRLESQTKDLSKSARENQSLRQDTAQLRSEADAVAEKLDGCEKKLHEAIGALTQKDGESELLLTTLQQAQNELENAFVEHERLSLANVQLEAQTRTAEADRRIAEERERELTTHRQELALLEQEKQALAVKLEVEIRLAGERNREFEVLLQSKAQLEQEKQSLAIRHEVQSGVVAQRVQEVESLERVRVRLEQEKQTLTGSFEAQSKALEERRQQLEVLKEAKLKLEGDKQALTVWRDGHKRVAEERGQEIETLKLASAKLEQEKKALTEWRDGHKRVAEERGRELETLKQVKSRLEHENSVLEKQRKAAGTRSNNGDADIDDLIGDLETFFNGRAIIYVDVGAYVGDVFLKIKRSVTKFRIHEAHLFEPNPHSYAQLTGKVEGTNSPAVHTYNLAIGESGNVHRFVPAKSMTKVLSDDVQAGSGPGDVFTAHCVSLDSQSSIFTDGKINLLKIDVEGKEMDVLSSARQLLVTQSVDILYIEVGFNRTGTQQTYFADIDRFLQECGYRVLRIYEQKEEWMSDSPLLRRANIAYMSEKFANAHPLKLVRELNELKMKLNELTGDVLDS